MARLSLRWPTGPDRGADGGSRPAAQRRGTPAQRAARPQQEPSLVERTTLGAVYFLVLVLSFLQQPGRTTLDTRGELTERPGSFLAGALSLWHGDTNFGEIQNQAYGYLFPMGPYFWLMDLAHVPDWMAQRLWTALLLIAACEGARRVALAIGMKPAVAVVAGVVFMMSPRLIGTIGVLTAESLPGVVLPWVVLPLVHALAGRIRPWPAIVMSAATIVFMGGVNAVENIANLPLPGILLLWGAWRQLIGWRSVWQWTGLSVVAGLWWLLPLVVLGRYSPPFYQYVESAQHTTGVIGWGDAIRGSTHWVAHVYVGNSPWWPAANELATTPHLILVAAVVSAIGLYGLLTFRNDLRLPLLASLGLGLGLLTVAHGGWEGAPVSDWFQRAFDGPLQIFRNVHKVDPIVRLPLALGFANAIAQAIAAVIKAFPRAKQHAALLTMIPLLVPLMLGQPFLLGHGRIPGYEQIPQSWQSARNYLLKHSDGRPTLVLPGTGFAMQSWGWTLDEPLLLLGDVPYVTRSQVPLISGQGIRSISALNEMISSGKGTAALNQQLARAGIGHVLIRRDLDRATTGSPHPGGAEASVRAAGLKSVAKFGTVADGGPEIEIFNVATRVERVVTTSASDTLTVAGSPESYLSLQEAGLLAREQATVLEGEADWAHKPDVVTDETARRERAFGQVENGESAVLQEGQPWRQKRAAHNFPGAPGARETVARYPGLASLSASSSQGYADTFGAVSPSFSPYSAVDGDPRTRWQSSPLTDPTKQWIELEFTQPRPVRQVRILPVVGDPGLDPVRTFEVRAGKQVKRVDVNSTGAWATVRLDGTDVSRVRVSVVRAAGVRVSGQVAIRDVVVDNLVVRRTMVVPTEVGPGAAFLFTTPADRRACVVTNGAPDCDTADIQSAEESQGLNRAFTSAQRQEIQLSGRASARATAATARLLSTDGADQIVGSTSILGDDPRVAERFAYDGDPQTAWRSATQDGAPALTFVWDKPHRITDVFVESNGELENEPKSMVVTANGETQKVSLDSGGLIKMKPVTTDKLVIQFEKRQPADSLQISEVRLAGFEVTRPWNPRAGAGAFCGLGPNIWLDGEEIPTRINATMGDIVDDRPVRWVACDARTGQPRTVELLAGTHELRTESSAEFQVIMAAGTPVNWDLERAPAGDERIVNSFELGNSGGRIELSEGAETVMSIDSNFNPGWQASLDGKALAPLRVDGWRQGWVVPAGVAGPVDVSFGPQTFYSVIMIFGLLVAALMLVLGALARRWNRVTVAGPSVARPSSSGPSGVWQSVKWPESRTAPRPVALALLVATWLLLGWVAASGLVLGWLLRRNPVRIAALVATVVVLSGYLAGYQPITRMDRVPDALGAFGLGLAFGATLIRFDGAVQGAGLQRRGLWAGWTGLAAIALISVAGIWRTVIVRGSYFNQDDYYLTSRALAHESLSWSFLYQDINGHLTPFQQLCYWLVAHYAPFHWQLIAVSIVAVQVVAMVAMWHLLSRLLPGRVVRIVLLVAFATSTMTLGPTAWWSAAMGLWPPTLASIVAMLFLVRAHQSAGREWVNLVAATATMVFGLLWHERAILIAPTLFLLAVALAPESGAVTRLRWALQRWWQLWVALVALSVGFVAMHLVVTTVRGGSRSASVLLEMTGRFIFNGALPGFISAPWRGVASGTLVFVDWPTMAVALAIVAAIGLWLLRRGGPARGAALAFLVGYLTLDVAMILIGRSGWGGDLGLDSRYFADALHIGVVAAALALRGAPLRFGLSPARWLLVRRFAPAGLVLAYLASVSASTALMLPTVQNPQDRAFVGNLRAELQFDPDVVLYDRKAPSDIVWQVAGHESKLSAAFAALPEAPVFNQPTNRLRGVADDGRIYPITLKNPAVPSGAETGGCAFPIGSDVTTATFAKPVPPLSDGTELVAKLEIISGSEMDLEFEINGRKYLVRVEVGPQTAWLVLPAADGDVRAIQVRAVDSDQGACLAAASVGAPRLDRK